MEEITRFIHPILMGWRIFRRFYPTAIFKLFTYLDGRLAIKPVIPRVGVSSLPPFVLKACQSDRLFLSSFGIGGVFYATAR
jgi:hypothetical protein